MTLLRENDLYRVGALYTTLDVDNEDFRDITGAAAEWQRQVDEFQMVSVALQYGDLDYKGANDVRDSHLYQLALGYRRAFIGPWQPLFTTHLYLGQEDNRRDRDDLSRNLYGFRASVSGSPAAKWAASAGAFYQLFSIDGEPDSRTLVFRLIDEANVGLAPGTAFGPGAEPYLRLCFARSPESLGHAVERLTAWLKR